ncbi:MAG: NUDIX hydrolase [Bacteroidales bacterium]|nr:NUDIX hydrolase [Bacteroidales bacterium]
MTANLNPCLSVDCVVFGFDGNELKVLLINRDPSTGCEQSGKLKLPGDLIIRSEMLTIAAQRILSEFTGLHDIYLKQFGIFDDPQRLNSRNDLEWLENRSDLKIERVVTVAYYSLVKIDKSVQTDLSIAYNACWYSCSSIPLLIFDHNNIIDKGLDALRRELLTEPLCFELLPEKFTLNQLQRLYETILGCELDNRNFRKKIQRLPYIVPLYERQNGVNHKPAQLHVFDNNKYASLKKDHTVFIL